MDQDRFDVFVGLDVGKEHCKRTWQAPCRRTRTSLLTDS